MLPAAHSRDDSPWEETNFEIILHVPRHHANRLNQAVTVLAPRRIILGGGISLIGEDLWFAPIRRQLDVNIFPPLRGTFDVVPAALGEEVVVHGALALAHDTLGRPGLTNHSS